MTATISPNEFQVEHATREDVNREFLKFPISGWDEVKKLTKKVLIFEGRKFVFSCWNSDENYCIFYRLIDCDVKVARWA